MNRLQEREQEKWEADKAAHGFGPNDHPESIRCASHGEAWTLVLTARQRGWDVTDPVSNGMGVDVHFVYVWKRGPDDERPTR